MRVHTDSCMHAPCNDRTAATTTHVVERPLEGLRCARFGLVCERRVRAALLQQAAADERVERLDGAVLQGGRELQRPQQRAALCEDCKVVEHRRRLLARDVELLKAG